MTVLILFILSLQIDDRTLSHIEDINPELREIVVQAYLSCDEDFIVIDGMRTLEEQEEHLETGASTTIHSKHLTGNAIDFVLPSFDWDDIDGFKRVGECFKEFEGISYGGDWVNFKDYGHIEYSPE